MVRNASVHPIRKDVGEPILLFDIMDTIVVDPFFTHMPQFFGLTFQQLLEQKHPTAWVEFEIAEIDESQLLQNFFKDGRTFEGGALLKCMCSGYDYIDGMEPLLGRLAAGGYEMHAFSNYPMWYRHIEAKLQIGRYLNWTFVSCEGPLKGLRKPNPEAYKSAMTYLGLRPSQVVFIDDREVNVKAAEQLGIRAVRFQSARQLESDLTDMGFKF